MERTLGPRMLIAATLFAAGCAGAASPPEGPTAAAGHPGFDTWRYPGDAAMREWRQSSPYRWVGYYLPAPCHRGTTWVGKRETLERTGWGIAVLYVGQQRFEGQADPDPSTPTDSIICSRTLLNETQGASDAKDAAGQAAREGFASGTVIFLDVERMEHATPDMVEYYGAWVRGIIEDGRYRPGTYAHRRNAAELYVLAQRAHADSGGGEPTFWVAGGSGFSLSAPPEASGLTFADVWQGVLDVDRTWGGTTIRIDENVAASPSPSSPR